MQKRRYLIYDVFADQPLAGNPLAVVLDGEGLDDAAMMKIAREFNLSETVFVRPPARPAHGASIRIFTPEYELPFAGHPTVGTAIALSELPEAPNADSGTALVVLEEKIGNVRCAVSRENGRAFAEFDLPQLPRSLEFSPDVEAIAASLGLGPHEIGFENHRVSLWSAGVPYVLVPVAGLDAARRARLDGPAWLELAPRRDGGNPACAFLYCREAISHDSDFHARMFVPGPPVYEDPATGSAVAAFAGALVFFDELRDGAHQLRIEQGLEMGRPSHIRLEIDIDGREIAGARIGGHAVKVAEGWLAV
ncbi:PhzF family phenazine biosynthesis protein [Aquamicrobium sp. LC103]|uniref:PhzF family phenazine biosynthesis protein n=1 Tax=Aquamicrobium sp. LC103 TaxID=1120658 RepID=UPI00063ECA64|nr:PhzF family phenazine biosynthesis protein [Aquamicrobium sp. LC103]TKT80076.1 PhzF family phenazine biosynthesis protein [Aquamicrobium sp. LC103]